MQCCVVTMPTMDCPETPERLRKRSGRRRTRKKDAAIGIVAWATHGALQPTVSDFATLRFAASITVTGLRLWPLEELTATSTDGRRLAVFFPP